MRNPSMRVAPDAGRTTPVAPRPVPLVRHAMLRQPQTLPSRASVGAVRQSFESRHVHLVLLVDGDRLVTTIARTDIEADVDDEALALGFGQFARRTVDPDVGLDAVMEYLRRAGERRLAVVDGTGRLLGLLCLKRSGTGFCSDRDVRSRTEGRRLAVDPVSVIP